MFLCIAGCLLFAVCRDIVKLTAQFVARNGAHFLDKLMVREQRNYQFDFLRKQHPLFNYFTKLVEQYSKILMPPHARLHQMRREIENPYVVGLLLRSKFFTLRVNFLFCHSLFYCRVHYHEAT